MVGQDTASSSNQLSFLTVDSATKFLRPVNSGGYTSEMATFVANMGSNVVATNQNALLTGTVNQTATAWVNSLTMVGRQHAEYGHGPAAAPASPRPTSAPASTPTSGTCR